ncbi:MAG: SDR family oxidoreductase [bacterium]|nr:SDR family oxidoreductase [bacterium]MDE0289310.1 SDR family oxidoreductase [bacterium]
MTQETSESRVRGGSPVGALVTGGARGIGRGIAERLARRGDIVFIADIQGEEDTARELQAEGLDVRPLRLDVRDANAIGAAVEHIDGDTPLGTVVNNAGIGWARPLVEVTAEDFDGLMAVNLRAVFFGIQAAAKVMIPRGAGCIVNTASTSAFTASSTPMVPYDTSKGAVRMLTVAAARELAPFGVRVNAVAPGTIDTEMVRSVLGESAARAQAGTLIPLGRLGQPADIAAAVDFLSSEAASYVTGHVMVVDGGWLT